MNQIIKFATVWQGRIGLGVVFVGSVIIGLLPDYPRPIASEKLIACVIAGTAWLAAEFASATAKISNHDVALFKRITDVLDDDALTFLINHDFHNYTYIVNTLPVTEISYWHGPSVMFNDRAIQKKWAKLFASIISLSRLYGSNLVNRGGDGRLTAWHDGFSMKEQPKQAYEEIRQLNESAAALYTECGEFIMFARDRLSL